ncbi:MAG: hypothetical protein LUF92_13090 [Clostridiales bacterium]|nr:hypothetical protein [Clostridiales bacterium]
MNKSSVNNNMNHKKKGRYHNDYSPRYQEQYDIYEKAREHIKKRKKEDRYSSGG